MSRALDSAFGVFLPSPLAFPPVHILLIGGIDMQRISGRDDQ